MKNDCSLLAYLHGRKSRFGNRVGCLKRGDEIRCYLRGEI
jgi:hypothetical protein